MNIVQLLLLTICAIVRLCVCVCVRVEGATWASWALLFRAKVTWTRLSYRTTTTSPQNSQQKNWFNWNFVLMHLLDLILAIIIITWVGKKSVRRSKRKLNIRRLFGTWMPMWVLAELAPSVHENISERWSASCRLSYALMPIRRKESIAIYINKYP